MLLLAFLLTLTGRTSALVKSDDGLHANVVAPLQQTGSADPAQSSLNPSFFWPYDYLRAQDQTPIVAELAPGPPVAEYSVPAFIKSAQGDELRGHDYSAGGYAHGSIGSGLTLGAGKLDFATNKKVGIEKELPKVEVKKIVKEVPTIEIKKVMKEVPVYVYEMPPLPEFKPEKEVKEIPVYVYNMPEFKPLPALEKEFKEIPVYVYEMPPFPEFKPPPLPELPEIVFEKHILPEIKPLELPKFESVKEIPIVFYELPPMPEIKHELPEFKLPHFRLEKHILPQFPGLHSFDFPKIEPIEEIPIVMYELPPLPEVKPLPEMKMPKFRLEKYILPPFPEMKFDMPKFDVPEEIPLVMYEFPPFPEVKHDFKLPEIKVVKYQMPPMEEAKPLEWPKIPEMKVVKYQMPPQEVKPFELPPEFKFPEIKFVKYQMPPKEKFPEFKVPEVRVIKHEMPEVQPLPEFQWPEVQPLPEFQWPEVQPFPEFKWPEIQPLPELKLPEIKPIELPPIPEFKFPEYQPMPMYTMPNIHAPAMINIPIPVAYNYPMVAMQQPMRTKGFDNSKFKTNHIPAPPPQYYLVDTHGYIPQDEVRENYIASSNGHYHHDSALQIGNYPQYLQHPYVVDQQYIEGQGYNNHPQYLQHPYVVDQQYIEGQGYYPQSNAVPQFIIATADGSQPVVTSDGEVSQLYVADSNNAMAANAQPDWLTAFQANMGSFQQAMGSVPQKTPVTPTSEL